MLKATEFDLKTGQTLTEYDSDAATVGQRRPKVQEIEHSYLEQWFEHHSLEPPSLFVAQFYQGVDAADQERLANDGRVLFSTNGAKGYFTDPETAALIGQGDPERGIEPVYAADSNSAHNAVAYGSLILSDGKASQVLQNESQLPIRILVVDDEQRDVGNQPLTNFKTEQRLESSEVAQLLDRMGDGTMLVTPSVIQDLITPQDVQTTLKKALKDADPEEIERLSAHYLEQGSFEGAGLQSAVGGELEDAVRKTLNQTVIQFRAATPDFPGIAKGTLTASELLDDLGVDLVISANDIKGDDGRFSRPGIHEVDRFWLNRKSDARHRTQVVGPQVKGTIPEATARELNPKALERLEKLNQAATDPHQLAQAYVTAKQEKQANTESFNEKPDWLATVLEADTYGTLERFPSVVDRLERWVRGERVEIALSGNEIPSATAQHHSQIKPWEVCNPKLPDGALVAYYRSPFPNAGAAALAINNHAALKNIDKEAFDKQGVAYLNPWTAKTICITDFDGDANGFFVGFEDKTGGLAAQLREQLSALENEPPAVQYEAARATFAQLIEQQAKDPEQSPLRPADYPQVVQAFVEQNAPENKPPAITKQTKIKHAWNPDTERLDQAMWRAWETTANNPIGRVANAGMVLQSFANECAHGERDPAGLARQVSQAYSKVLKQVDQGKLDLPSDGQLEAQGLPALNLRERLERIAGGELDTAQTLAETHDLLMDVANGPVALNLQTAVDIAKSSRGIDESLQQLARALQYKTNELRAERKNPQIYTQDQVFPINTDEPTAWMAQAVNAAYEVTQLPRIDDKIAKAFGPLVNGEVVPEQAQAAQELCGHYYGLVGEQTQAARRLAQQEPRALEQPSLMLTSASSGKTIQVERLIDGLEGKAFDWRAQGQTDWQITIRRDEAGKGLVVEQGPERQRLGWVNPVSAREAGLEQAVSQKGQVVLNGPAVQLKPPVRLENDLDELRAKPQQYLEEATQDWGAAEQKAMATALWQTNIERPGQTQARMGMNLAMRILPEQIAAELSKGPPPIYVSRSPGVEVMPEGQFTAQIKSVMEPNKAGQLVERLAVFQQPEAGEPIRLGLLAGGNVQLAAGIEAKASMQETLVQAAKMTVTTPMGSIAVTQVQQFELSEAAFQSQAATLQLRPSSDGIQVQVVQPGGAPKTLGRLGADTREGRAAARQFWRDQGERPWDSTLERGSYSKLELRLEGPSELAQPRTLEQAVVQQQQASQVSPSYSQLQQWWQVAHAQQDPELQAAVQQMGDGLVLAWQEQGNSDAPPLNFRSAEIALEPQQAEQMQQALAWRQEQQPSYSPSYEELQGLWRRAGQVGNSQLQERVVQLGQQLVAAFQYEHGAQGKPGADYRCGDVRLGVAERSVIYGSQQQVSIRDRKAKVGGGR